MVSTATFAYDRLNALTASSWSPVLAQAPPTASSATFTYGYNGANQRTSQAATDNSYWSYPAATAAAVSYTANNLDQYSAIGAVTPAYDGNGNLTSDGTFTYGYDAESRLISASGAGNTASYAYDAQGRRKSKTLNGTTTLFVQDPQGRALLDYAGSGGAVQAWYAFGLGPNDVLNQVSGPATTRATYVPDIQGSIIASLDASTGTLSKAGFQPYGESGSTAGTFRYTGARIDAETGLYDFRGRMYSPLLGRFPQTDPIETAGGVNLYAYVGNDPLNLVDIFGLAADGSSQASGSSGYSLTDASPDPVKPGAQYAQAAMGLCAAGPGGCAVGAGITAGQVLFGGAVIGGAGAVGLGAGSVINKAISNSDQNQNIDGGSSSAPLVHGNSAASMQPTQVYYLINNSSGVIDKIGITSNPASRYPQSYLDAENVRYVAQTQYLSRYPAIVDENIRLVWYQIQNGSLPRLNKLTR